MFLLRQLLKILSLPMVWGLILALIMLWWVTWAVTNTLTLVVKITGSTVLATSNSEQSQTETKSSLLRELLDKSTKDL